MSEPKFFWHIHHQTLCEVATEPIRNRIRFIKKQKPKHEQKLRLRLLKPVRGKLPAAIVEAYAVYIDTYKAFREASKVYNKTWDAYVKAGESDIKALEAYHAAKVVWEGEWTARGNAYIAYEQALVDHKEEAEALHAIECPNCPWDGNTIFPVKEAKV